MSKDRAVVLLGYGYIAPTALPYVMFAHNPWPPLRSDQGATDMASLAGLSLSESFAMIAVWQPKGPKMTPEGGLKCKVEKEAIPVTKLMDVALQSVV